MKSEKDNFLVESADISNLQDVGDVLDHLDSRSVCGGLIVISSLPLQGVERPDNGFKGLRVDTQITRESEKLSPYYRIVYHNIFE